MNNSFKAHKTCEQKGVQTSKTRFLPVEEKICQLKASKDSIFKHLMKSRVEQKKPLPTKVWKYSLFMTRNKLIGGYLFEFVWDWTKF